MKAETIVIEQVLCGFVVKHAKNGAFSSMFAPSFSEVLARASEWLRPEWENVGGNC